MYFIYSQGVSAAFKLCMQKNTNHTDCQVYRRRPTAKGEYIGIVMFTSHLSHIIRGTKSSSRPFHLVGGDAHADACAADEDPLEAAIEIKANPKGKRIESLTLLSGGEKALTAISLLFGIYLVKPSPICILDEVDAPLDDNNIQRFLNAIKQFANSTQFIIVTHNKLTMKSADCLYGITMEESGVSKIVSVKLD